MPATKTRRSSKKTKRKGFRHQTKKCRKCGKRKKLNTDYFYENSKSADGFTSWCKECTKKASKKFRESEEGKEYYAEYRTRRYATVKMRTKRRVYNRMYRFERYHEDPEFRERVLGHSRKWKKRERSAS